MTEPRVTIVGLGIIGGSLARALHARGWRVRALSPDANERAAAAALGFIVGDTHPGSLDRAAGESVLIVLAVPIAALNNVGARAAAATPRGTVILHTASLLSPRALGLDDAVATRLIGTHPLAGSHLSGFAASDAALLARCTVVAEERAPTPVRAVIERLWMDAGAERVVYAEAEAHDRALAWTSQLPQLTASALAATFAASGQDSSFAGPGLRDTTRLAMSPLDLWKPILSGDPAEAIRALDALERTIHELREALKASDTEQLETIWERARQWRNELPHR